jgi:hypothetical protein
VTIQSAQRPAGCSRAECRRTRPGAYSDLHYSRVLDEHPICGDTVIPMVERAGDRSGGNLPAAVTSFVGRRREIGLVRQCLSASRLVTLTGSGGVGKTRLAVEVAADRAGRSPMAYGWSRASGRTRTASCRVQGGCSARVVGG